MFEREHHRNIALVLQALSPQALAKHRCWFGGGTAMALRYGEYRESVDVDFLVSETKGYRALRERLTGPAGVQSIARRGALLEASREVRADQYGIRTLLRTDGVDVKFEIVSERRIVLEVPGGADRVCGVATLTALDMAASKLLANSDRWGDDAVMSRDLIDLAMMQPKGKLLKQAIEKAQGAYGDSSVGNLASKEITINEPHPTQRHQPQSSRYQQQYQSPELGSGLASGSSAPALPQAVMYQSQQQRPMYGDQEQSQSHNKLQKPHRKFGDAYETEHGHAGTSGPAKRVMDFFRKRGRARGVSEA